MKLRFAAIAVILVLILVGTPQRTRAWGTLIRDVNTNLARYNPGNSVTIYVDLNNQTGSSFNGSISLSITHKGVAVSGPGAQSVSVGNGQSASLSFTWTPPNTNYRGYQIDVTASDGSGVRDINATAVDVSSDWGKFPRYGYVSEFGQGIDAYNWMWKLKNYHINAIQFYDWQYKHHIPYPGNGVTVWKEIANRDVYRSTLTSLIDAAHNYNMLAMNYNLYGGAYDNYWNDGVPISQGIYMTTGSNKTPAQQYRHPLPGSWATPYLYQMNIRDTGWKNFIFAEEAKVFNNFAFDGWHIDTLGDVGTTYDWNNNQFSQIDHYASFVNDAKTSLNKRMVFNTVNAWGQDQIASNANVDVVYSEIWTHNGGTYQGLIDNIESIKSRTSKGIVLPAYMNYEKGKNFTDANPGSFNEPGIRLANATIFAGGASHLELGDNDNMLLNEYFPNKNLVMNASTKASTRDYYRFLTAYENLLRDGVTVNSKAITISNQPTSTNGSTGTVWMLKRKTAAHDIVHLINLKNSTSNQWRDTNGTTPAAPQLTNLSMKLYYNGGVGGSKLFYASPDYDFGKPFQISYTTGSDGGGSFITFNVPRLWYWSMVWLETTGSGTSTRSAFNRIEAETFDSQVNLNTENTSDMGGGLNVCCSDNNDYAVYNNIDFGSGAASMNVRVATATSGGTIEFRLGSTTGTLIASVGVTNTGGWQSWQTRTVSVSGASGVHNLYMVFKGSVAGIANVNWWQFSTSGSPTFQPPTNTPTGGINPFNVVQAESYNAQSGIQNENTSDTGGGQNVCCTDNGDWVVYNNVNFGSGAANLDVRVASAVSTGRMDFRLGSTTGTIIATVNTGNTGGWQSWQTKTVTVTGATGTHNLYIVFTSATNLNWWQFR
jgi:dextranase